MGFIIKIIENEKSTFELGRTASQQQVQRLVTVSESLLPLAHLQNNKLKLFIPDPLIFTSFMSFVRFQGIAAVVISTHM